MTARIQYGDATFEVRAWFRRGSDGPATSDAGLSHLSAVVKRRDGTVRHIDQPRVAGWFYDFLLGRALEDQL